jgi:hypothetical protein
MVFNLYRAVVVLRPTRSIAGNVAIISRDEKGGRATADTASDLPSTPEERPEPQPLRPDCSNKSSHRCS